MGQSTNEWILGRAYLASPADFAEADDIITNLAKEREPGSRSSNALPNLSVTSFMVYKGVDHRKRPKNDLFFFFFLQ